MSLRVDLVRVEHFRRTDFVSSHSPVPLLPLNDAAGSPTLTNFGIVATVEEVYPSITLPSMSINSEDSFLLRRQQILLRDNYSPTAENNVQALFFLTCFGPYAPNLELCELEKGDGLIISIPSVYLKRWIPGLDPADLRFSPYEVFVGHNANDRSDRKSEIIILRKTKGEIEGAEERPPSATQLQRSTRKRPKPADEDNGPPLSIDNEDFNNDDDVLDASSDEIRVDQSTTAKDAASPSPGKTPPTQSDPRSSTSGKVPTSSTSKTSLLPSTSKVPVQSTPITTTADPSTSKQGPVQSTSKTTTNNPTTSKTNVDPPPSKEQKRFVDQSKKPDTRGRKVLVAPDRTYSEIRLCKNVSSRYNVWAVVTRISRDPTPTRGTRLMAIVYIQDQTCEGSFGFPDFQFNILGLRLEDFPPFAVGDVIRVCHMKVELYNDEYTGKVFEPQGIVVFPGRVGDPITPICTSAKFTFTDHDKARVEEMREWWQQLNPNMYDLINSQSERCISEVDHPMTFDLTCKVFEILDSKEDSSHGGKVLRVQDGTRSQLPLLSVADCDNDNSGASNASNSTSVIKLDSRNHRLLVDIFVKAHYSFVEDISLGDVILLTGVRCTEETCTDGENGIRTTVYRLIIPDEGNIDCRVLPAGHSSTKQVNRQIIHAAENDRINDTNDSWIEHHLKKINAGFDEDVEQEYPDSNPVNQQQTSNLFPDSQEFNHLILNSSNINGLGRSSQHAEVGAGPSQRDDHQQERTDPNSERPKRSMESQMMQQQETEYARHSRSPMVTICAANGEELMFEPDQSEVSENDNPAALSQTGQISSADTSKESSRNTRDSSESSYFTCPEERDDLDSSRCSPTPDRQILAIKTVTNYPWATFEELSESSNGRKHRIKGFVKGILPSTDNPMDMLYVLCPDDCCAGQKPPGSRIATCRQCKKPCDIIFNFALEISETEMSNFATTAPAKRMFCSGLNADQLLGCKSIDFNSSESIQRAVLAKWNDLVNKAVQLSALVLIRQNGSKEFHIIDSEIV